MAVFKWRGGWAHDYRDGGGTRHRDWYRTEREARDEERRLGTAVHATRRHRPRVDPRSTVADYALRWLERIAPPALKRAAHAAHAYAVTHYIVPRLGAIRLLDLRRSDCKDFLAGCQKRGIKGPLSRASLRVIYSALRSMLNAAIDDELVTGNVAAKLGRQFRLQPSAHERQAAAEQRVLEPAERKALLEAARTDGDGAWYPLVLTYDRAGLRLGEGLALEVSDIRFEARKIRVRQAIDGHTGQLDDYDSSPKHGPRQVDLSPGLAEVLEAHITGLELAAKAAGRKLGKWLFPSEAGTPLDAHNVRRTFRRLSRAAGLEQHVTPHDLRHTFGSTLAATELPQYVQQQMGHRDISTTIGTYGSAFAARPKRGVAALDDGMVEVVRRSRGDKVVTIGRGKTREVDASD